MPITAARCVARSDVRERPGRERRRGGDRMSSYGPQVEVAIARVRADVAKLHAELTRNGLVVWTGGNVSGRVPGADLFVIKPSGVSYDDLAPENMILCDLDGNVIEGTPGADRVAVVGHRGARLRVPEHARGRRRRAHALRLRDRLGGARRGDPVRDHGDGRRVRRADPGGPVRDHRRRLDRAWHRRDADRPPQSRGADAQPRAVHDRREREGCGQGRRHGRGRRPHRAPRPRGRPARPIPQDAIDSLFDRYQNVYGQAHDARRSGTEAAPAAGRRKTTGKATDAGSAKTPGQAPDARRKVADRR